MSRDTFRTSDGCSLAYVDEGWGLPVLWQHGLGADRNQPGEVFPAIEGVRRITLECRGHGASQLGDEQGITIAQFAADAMALLDHLGVERAVVGGISLGAAIALHLAALYPERTAGLILARPAWVDERTPETLKIYREVAALLAGYGPEEGGKRLEASPRLQEVERVSPDNGASMRGFFKRDLVSTVALLSRIPAQSPGICRAEIKCLDLPTLVIANGQDFVHPVETARTLHDLIPGSQFRLITSKTVSRQQYVGEFKQALQEFLEPMRSRSGGASCVS
jgi:pimeloyl-ACP methyl ester carboxylesterase